MNNKRERERVEGEGEKQEKTRKSLVCNKIHCLRERKKQLRYATLIKRGEMGRHKVWEAW